VTLNSATLNGKVNPNYRETTWYFEYGLTTGYEWSTPSESEGSGSTRVSASRSITGLSRDTTYHYRIVAENSFGESHGGDKTFRTTIIYVEPYGACGTNAPCYETIQEAIDVAGSGGTIKIAEESYYEDVTIGASGNVRLEGGWDAAFTARSSMAQSSGAAMTGTLVIGASMDGTVLVDGLVLQTECTVSPPIITTESATLNGTVNPNVGNTTYWFRYGKTTAYGTTTSSTSAGSGSSSLPVNASISGLSDGTIYHYQVVATNCAGTSYGSDQSFTTLPATTPTVTTTTVSAKTSNSASSGGNITSDGGVSVTARGVCWSTPL